MTKSNNIDLTKYKQGVRIVRGKLVGISYDLLKKKIVPCLEVNTGSKRNIRLFILEGLLPKNIKIGDEREFVFIEEEEGFIEYIKPEKLNKIKGLDVITTEIKINTSNGSIEMKEEGFIPYKKVSSRRKYFRAISLDLDIDIILK